MGVNFGQADVNRTRCRTVQVVAHCGTVPGRAIGSAEGLRDRKPTRGGHLSIRDVLIVIYARF